MGGEVGVVGGRGVRDVEEVGALGGGEEVGEVEDEGGFGDEGHFVGGVGAGVIVEVGEGGLVVGGGGGCGVEGEGAEEEGA